MSKTFYKTLLAASCAAAFSGISFTANAANWLTLQGTEAYGASARAKIWGFIQPEYQHIGEGTVPAGPFAGSPMQPNLIGPDRKARSSFNIRRARIGVRGEGMPIDPNVNYFLLAEFGNNGVTRPGNGNGAVRVTDASITLNHLKDITRVRVGQFKYPGSEEGLQAIHVFDYVNFTNMTDGLLLERFTDGDGSGTPGNGAAGSGLTNNPNGPVGAFRDIGVQFFETFKQADWEHSYAFMVGNGNGISRGDNNNKKDFYAYWSSEKVFKGNGARRQGLKMFAWYQKGERTLTTEGAGTYDRKRWGVGTTFRKDKYRAAFEYVKADGMIRNGTDGAARPGSVPSGGPGAGVGVASLNVNTNGEADGWYGHFGYAVTPKWELDIRYDVLNRSTETSAGERKFETVTLGTQYFFNKKTRLIFNHEFRDLEAPGLPASAPPNVIGKGLKDRTSIQLLHIF